MQRLWKTTIVIWSDENPETMELEDLARDATSGGSYCSKCFAEIVENPAKDCEWDGTDFFEDLSGSGAEG